MDSWLRCWSLAALLCSFPGTGDTAADPTNGTGPMSLSVERDISHKSSAAEILLSLLETGTLDVEKTLSQKTRSGGEDSFLDSKPWRITKAKLPQKKPPRTSLASAGVMASSAAPTGQAGGLPATVSTLEYHPTGINIDNESSICAGCGGETVINERPPSRSLLSERNGGSVESVTNFGWPAEHGTVDWEFRKSLIKGDKPSASESQEDSGSGDPRVKMPSGQVTHSSSLKTEWDLGELLGMATSTPSQTTSTGTNALVNPSTDKAISPDSAEIDHLLQVSRETTLQPPSPSDEYEEGGIEDDDEEDDLEEAEDLDDEMAAREAGNVLKAATLTPKVRTVMVDEKPTSIQDDLFRGELFPKFHPDVNKDQTQTMSGTNENSTECRSGFVRRNNSCKSLCEIYPTYCFNGGQCYIVEGAGALCRCNTQDYIWHKGLRCESIITDFQVMCVAVGTAALVVLLLFMMTVFFAKKLYLLKTENYKLRKRNRYRTPSELHNDNFSLSTIAEGSHPNVRKLCDTPSNLSPHARALAYYDNVICQEDPNASQKVQDLPKACLKDEEPFNIQNSLSPKLESGKGDPDIVDVNCVLNNLT
ncbi:chondroitin sulfate proteoglycan 5 isoform X3 [Pseudophryne corroboree]|uniref:chondroitin sulfate proteoglycan 5 isoform X3 n=1 Tax=Pseudophryne corroboree TaxID=495146 RepID=UPI003081819D